MSGNHMFSALEWGFLAHLGHPRASGAVLASLRWRLNWLRNSPSGYILGKRRLVKRGSSASAGRPCISTCMR